MRIPQMSFFVPCNMLFPSLHQTQIPYGSRVLVRASLNVPLQDGEVASTFRIQRTSATIKLLLDWGCSCDCC